MPTWMYYIFFAIIALLSGLFVDWFLNSRYEKKIARLKAETAQ